LLIQPDWDHFFRDSKITKETVWVQFKSSEKSSVNGKILLKNTDTSTLSEYEEKQNGINRNFLIENISKENNSIHISYKELNNNIITFIAPIEKYALHFNKNDKRQPVYSIDITNTGLGISSSTDGSLLVWTLKNGEIRRNLTGHISDVYVAKFFPSKIVAMSGGSDMRIKIWSVENGKSPVMLGHKGGISDFSIVDKGRNIVSVCRDGTCRLWDLGESNCLSIFGNFDCIINACDIVSLSSDKLSMLPETETIKAEREIGTENKLICCACEDGYIRVIALRSRVTIFKYKCESAVNCCCFINETTVVCGTQNGHIYIFDIENKNTPTDSWKEFRSSILSLQKFSPTNGLLVTTADGSCYIRNLKMKINVIELTGPDCDHVYKASYNETHVFTCCRDGFVRKYDLNHILNSQ